jgi:hypothetical protein
MVAARREREAPRSKRGSRAGARRPAGAAAHLRYSASQPTTSPIPLSFQSSLSNASWTSFVVSSPSGSRSGKNAVSASAMSWPYAAPTAAACACCVRPRKSSVRRPEWTTWRCQAVAARHPLTQALRKPCCPRARRAQVVHCERLMHDWRDTRKQAEAEACWSARRQRLEHCVESRASDEASSLLFAGSRRRGRVCGGRGAGCEIFNRRLRVLVNEPCEHLLGIAQHNGPSDNLRRRVERA